MKRFRGGTWAGLAAQALLLAACTGIGKAPEAPGAGASTAAASKIEAIILQINDVYEIGPVANGTQGGLARVARVRQDLLAENPNTFTVLAGDFVSPSALGTAEVDGAPLAGRQMIAALNAMGLDLATFGNHEFDIKEEQLRGHLAASKFGWISGNVTDAEGNPFPGVKPFEILTVSGAGGETLRLGVIGVTVGSNPQDWVRYAEPLATMERQAKAVADQVNVLVGLTHLPVSDDQEVAERVPALALIMGGHEHQNYYLERGSRPTRITKADSNVRSVYIHRLSWSPGEREVEIESHYLPITAAIAEEEETAKVVADWTRRGFEGFRKLGFDPEAEVAEIPMDFDGLESSVRFRATNLTRLIGDAMAKDVPAADLAIFNGGSIRIDDKLAAGPVTQYDVLRVLPYPGEILAAEIAGSLLQRALDQGLQNLGAGGFLQTSSNVVGSGGTWSIGGKDLDPQATYTIAINDYLATGRQSSLEFLDVNAGNPGFKQIGTHSDLRKAVIAELQDLYP